MKYTLWIFVWIWCSLCGYAQDSTLNDVKQHITDLVPVAGDADYTLSVAYFGNMVFHPGLRADLEKKWKTHHKIKHKNSRRKGKYWLSKYRELLPTAGLGFYVHPRQHVGTFADVGIKFRKTRSKSFRNRIARWSISTGLGVYRSFLPETYKVVNDRVKKVFITGRTYFYPYFSYGREKSWRKNPNHACFMTINTMFLMPYNTTTVPLLNLQIGYRFKFDKYLKKNEKSI